MRDSKKLTLEAMEHANVCSVRENYRGYCSPGKTCFFIQTYGVCITMFAQAPSVTSEITHNRCYTYELWSPVLFVARSLGHVL